MLQHKALSVVLIVIGVLGLFLIRSKQGQISKGEFELQDVTSATKEETGEYSGLLKARKLLKCLGQILQVYKSLFELLTLKG